MASLDNQQQHQTWVPYEGTKDCSQGFCSIYCPQWCYIIFPPPPPFSLDDGGGGGGSTTFSPLVIAIIGILAGAFLLVSYYTVVSKYCGTFSSFRRHRAHNPSAANPADTDDDGGGRPSGQSRRHDTWHVAPSNGLDEALINKITVAKYRRGDGLVDGTDCSVCLGEFREDESLRLLPKCSHAFHLQCIDTWLKSHSSCPLCRANIVSVPSVNPPPPPPPPPEPENSRQEGEQSDETVIAIEDSERGMEENSLGSEEDDASKDSEVREESYGIVEIGDDGAQPMRRSFSMGASHRGRVSIADVLEVSMEEEYMAARDHGVLIGWAGSSRRGGGGEHSKGGGRSRGLHCVMSPVPMKRSVSSGRFCFARHGKGRNSVLPI